MKKDFLLVGTYTQETSGSGIYCFAWENGRFVLQSSFFGCENPSYLTARQGTVYVAQELPCKAYVTALTLTASGVLQHKNTLCVPGNGACHLSLHPRAPVLYVSHFGSGDMVSCTIAQDGSLAAVSSHVLQTGNGPLAGMQDASHLHSATPDTTGRYVVTCNLGTDAITVYEAICGGGLVACGTPVRMPPGSGPRHFVFAPGGCFAYAVNELSNTVAVFAWNEGQLRLLSVQPLLPPAYNGACYAADVHCSGDGRFLYVSTREYNAVISFAINEKTSALTCVGRCETGGLWPRHFSLSPQENLLAVANQKSDMVSILTRNTATGLPGEVIQRLAVHAPVCAIWA